MTDQGSGRAVTVGKTIPIFLYDSQLLIGQFEVIAVNEATQECNVKWPNGFIDCNVPMSCMEGDMSYIDHDEAATYIDPL